MLSKRDSAAAATGPLAGVTVVEFAALGPVPFACMMLADMGARVIRIDRAGGEQGAPDSPLLRNRQRIALDLKQPEGRAIAGALIARADVLVEGFRPGVMERLGLGPQDCLTRNPALVYGRMTGWGQDGALAQAAGHDLNFLAMTGALAAIGPAKGPPVPPLNLVADFGGGAMMLAFGILAALLHVRAGGSGQVVDAAMTDGTALLMASVYAGVQAGRWHEGRGQNLLDGGCYYYRAYACADGRWIAVAPLEPAFYRNFLSGLGLAADGIAPDGRPWSEMDHHPGWPARQAALADLFQRRTAAEWLEIFGSADVCVSPVLSAAEALTHPVHAGRNLFPEIAGRRQPAPAPRLGATPGRIRCPASAPGGDWRDILAGLGLSAAEIGSLVDTRAVAVPQETSIGA